MHVILGFPIWWYVAFYAGWPKAWAVFNLSKEEYGKLNMIGRNLRYGRTSIIHLFCDCGCFLINKRFK